MSGFISNDYAHLSRQKNTALLSELEQTSTQKHTHTCTRVLVELAQVQGPSGVCQESRLKQSSTLTLMNDLSRPCPHHDQRPLYPGGCVNVPDEKGGATGVIAACVLVDVWARAAVFETAECVLFW